MRCLSCNRALTDYEATRKNLRGEYIDLCNDCLEPIKHDVHVIDRPDLLGVDNTETSEYCFDEWSDD